MRRCPERGRLSCQRAYLTPGSPCQPNDNFAAGGGVEEETPAVGIEKLMARTHFRTVPGAMTILRSMQLTGR